MTGLVFRIEVSPDNTGERCGDCMFVQYEGQPYCALFGCETLHRYPDGSKKRTNMCRHFERSGETVFEIDQQP